MKALRILGVDPGFDRLGVAIVEKSPSGERLDFLSCITTSPRHPFVERVADAAHQFEKILEKEKPEHLAIETLFVTKNQKTAMLVAEMRGVIIYLATKHKLSVFEYSPPQIKSAITGYGKSGKDDVAFMVSKILKQDLPKDTLDDAVDAVAVALTHSANYKPFFGKTILTQ